MAAYKGILSFNNLFTPRAAASGGDPRYSATLLLPPGDPQIPQIQQLVDTEIANGAPSGVSPRADICFQPYDVKFQGKDYYDPRFSGWYALSTNAKDTDKPTVVYANHDPVLDPGAAVSGEVVWLHANLFWFGKGNTGVAAGLNGVMLTGEMGPFGRLDNKPSVEQMFAAAGVAQAPAQNAPAQTAVQAPAQTAVQAPAQTAVQAPPSAPPAPPVHQMTASATGTYEEYVAAGWSDQQLIASGLMLPPAAVPSFTQ